MSELCTLCYKLYRVVVNFICWDLGIGSSDNLVEKGRDKKWFELLTCFMFAFLIIYDDYVLYL